MNAPPSREWDVTTTANVRGQSANLHREPFQPKPEIGALRLLNNEFSGQAYVATFLEAGLNRREDRSGQTDEFANTAKPIRHKDLARGPDGD